MTPQYEVMKTLILNEFAVGDCSEEPVRLRVEIWKDLVSNEFTPRVYRVESYSISPSFGLASGQSFDMELTVVDESQDWESLKNLSESALLEQITSLLIPK